MWLREVSKEKYKDTVGDVSVGTKIWPFLSNKWFANHRMQQSKAKGLGGGSWLQLLNSHTLYIAELSLQLCIVKSKQVNRRKERSGIVTFVISEKFVKSSC